jgi:putative nucleotidyltransferase with HDIG domain
LLQHVTVVAEVAAFLAYRAGQAGITVDRRLVETAALLHDIDKALPPSDAHKTLGHGAAGAAWLRDAGHPELARPITAHPVTRLAEPDARAWAVEAPIEDRIVTYADKRATQRVVSLEQRFERWQRRHPEYHAQLERAYATAELLETTLCGQVGLAPTDVERLRWVDDALERAFAAGVPDTRPARSPDGLPVFGAPVDPSAA